MTVDPSTDPSFILGQHEARLSEVEAKLGIHAGAIDQVVEEVEEAQRTAEAAGSTAVDALIAAPDLGEVREVAAEVAEQVAEAVSEVVAEEVAEAVSEEVADEVAAPAAHVTTEVAKETPLPPTTEESKPVVEDTSPPRRRPKPYGRTR